MSQIKVIKDFVSIDDANKIISYIDNNISLFEYTDNDKRSTKMFGKDAFQKDKSTYPITGLNEIHSIILNATEMVKRIIRYEYNENQDIFLTSLWLAKQTQGGFLGPHLDTDPDNANSYFAYSAVIYLNTLEDSGNLDFPRVGLSIQPEAGNLVIFPSGEDESWHEVNLIKENRYTVPLIFTRDKEFELHFDSN
jgi:Rps23 Pro-64 3,4-dihydroxylase Tpa1-like proline 4-hydroxylase